MKIIESREQRLLQLTVLSAANEDCFAKDLVAWRNVPRSESGWSPYEVWLTRVCLFRDRNPHRTRD